MLPSATRAFWDGLLFTRVVNWGRDFQGTFGYLVKNTLEALGWIDRKGAHAKLRVVPLGLGRVTGLG